VSWRIFFIGVAKILCGCVLCGKSISASFPWRFSIQNPISVFSNSAFFEFVLIRAIRVYLPVCSPWSRGPQFPFAAFPLFSIKPFSFQL
jgi:hypothetical protein